MGPKDGCQHTARFLCLTAEPVGQQYRRVSECLSGSFCRMAEFPYTACDDSLDVIQRF